MEEGGDLAGLGITLPSSTYTAPANNPNRFGKFTLGPVSPTSPQEEQPSSNPPPSPRPGFSVLTFDTSPSSSPPPPRTPSPCLSLTPSDSPSPTLTLSRYPPPTPQEAAAQHLREQRFSLILTPRPYHGNERKDNLDQIRLDLIESRMDPHTARILGTPETLNLPVTHFLAGNSHKTPQATGREPIKKAWQREEQRARVGSAKRETRDREEPDWVLRKKFWFKIREANAKQEREEAEQRARERGDEEVAGGWEFELPSPVDGEFQDDFEDEYPEEDEERARLLDGGQQRAIDVDHSSELVVDRSGATSRCGDRHDNDGSSDKDDQDDIVGAAIERFLQEISRQENPIRSRSKPSLIPRLRAGARNVLDATAATWQAVGGRYHLVKKLTRIPRLKRTSTAQRRQANKKTSRRSRATRSSTTTFVSSTVASRSKTTSPRHRPSPATSSLAYTTTTSASIPVPEDLVTRVLARKERSAPGRPRSKIARWTGVLSGLARPRADGPRGWITERHGVKWSGGRIPRRKG